MQRENESNPAPLSRLPLGLYEILAIVLLWNCAYKGGRVANTLYVLDLGADPLYTGLLLATYAAFPLVLAVFTGKIADRYGVRVPVLVGTICFVLGLGMGLGQPLTVILTYNYSPPRRHGEGLGLRIAINNSMHVTVPALFGAVGSLIGLAPVFWVSSAILVAGGCAARGRRA